MKKYFFVALAIVYGYAISFAQSKAIKAQENTFNSTYPNAKTLKWNKVEINFIELLKNGFSKQHFI
jgi:hypothetical protein